MTCALNAANEKANELFREGKFDFFGIPKATPHQAPPARPAEPRPP